MIESTCGNLHKIDSTKSKLSILFSLTIMVNAIDLEKSILDLSLIPAEPKPGLINVLIEIPAGSKNKYEFDKDMNAFALDRVLFSSVQYPYDYGFVPNTLADDGDPLDGMVMMEW